MTRGRMNYTAPVSTEELTFAMNVGSAAASGKTPLSGVGDKGITIDMGDGEFRDLQFTDNPSNRAMFAIRDQFPDKFAALMTRAWALGTIMKDDRMAEFTREVEGEPEATEVHQAVWDIAAIMPLNPQLLFNGNIFFKRVAERAREIGGPDGWA